MTSELRRRRGRPPLARPAAPRQSSLSRTAIPGTTVIDTRLLVASAWGLPNWHDSPTPATRGKRGPQSSSHPRCRMRRLNHKNPILSERSPERLVMVIGEPGQGTAEPIARTFGASRSRDVRSLRMHLLRRAEVCEAVQYLGGCDSPPYGEEEEGQQRGHGEMTDGAVQGCMFSLPYGCGIGARSLALQRCPSGRAVHAVQTRVLAMGSGRGDVKQSSVRAKLCHVTKSTCWKNSFGHGTTPLRMLRRCS